MSFAVEGRRLNLVPRRLAFAIVAVGCLAGAGSLRAQPAPEALWRPCSPETANRLARDALDDPLARGWNGTSAVRYFKLDRSLLRDVIGRTPMEHRGAVLEKRHRIASNTQCDGLR